MKALFCSFVIILTAVHCTVVKIPNGQLIGSYNGIYHSFLNIPFAEPPVGLNRFEAPIAYTTKWTGKRNATSPSVSCVQFLKTPSQGGVEDCLTLNVFTPDINPTRLYPVRVFIYGGAFMIGSSGDTAEQYVAQQKVVLVIPNYRIGPLGFLSSGDDLISGNFGLKDQQLAMKWVQENIQLFGGDPKRVVLTGVSAGGASVHAHLLNEISCKYFNSAISSSGVIINPWVMQPNPKEQFRKFVQSIGCESSNREIIKQCLQNRTTEELVIATDSLKHFNDNPMNVFGIVQEPNNVQDAFLTHNPIGLIKKGKICDVPWVVSYCDREGTVTGAEFLSLEKDGKELIGILNQRWLEIAPVVLFYNNTCVQCSETKATMKRNEYSEFLREKYMEGQDFSVETYLLLEKMFTNVLYVNGIKEIINLHRKYGKAPVYAFEYRKPWQYVIGNILSNRTEISFGADHAADHIYVLPLKALDQAYSNYTANDKFVAGNLIEMGRELSISGIANYDFRELPINNVTHTGKLTIYETYYVIESDTADEQCIRNVYNNTT